MQLSSRLPRVMPRVARKEITLFFASPMAWLFLAAFAGITLFAFFWGEAFFSRNIADVRPLFEWMPVLLILLCSTLTMRMWSEERRSGTLEHVLTQAAPVASFVLGKFIGCLALLALALAITLPLPLTVSFLGDLDVGPVVAGYLASFLLGACYIAIGLFVSSRTGNQIVSLIVSVAVCGVFYLIGSPLIVDHLDQQAGEWLRALSTGSRFDSITRGVLDIGDIVYYVSIAAVFLLLNIYSLERLRWPSGALSRRHRLRQAGVALLAVNALAANLWIGQLDTLRFDATEGRQYSLSESTSHYLTQLREPLLLRAYFSDRTHPLLAPLVPQMRDLLDEYAVAGKGQVRVEIVDPLSDPEIEAEANRQYGIEPVPFQVADRYQSSIVSSYFDVLVQYGDEHEVLGFRDLIEVKSRSENGVDVSLRNPEYDITRAIRKVLTDFQTAGNVFDSIAGDVTFTAYVSDDSRLPESLVQFRNELQGVIDEAAASSGGRLSVAFVDPEAANGAQAEALARDYGLRPMSAGLFSDEHFWFHLVLSNDERVVQLPLDDLTAETFERNLDAGLKRFATGFTRTIALVAPSVNPQLAQYGMPGLQFSGLENFLRTEHNVIREDLGDGSVASTVDLVLLLAPEALDERELFAIDQFLMKGGTVIVATSPFSATLTRDSLTLSERRSGLEDWLAHHGFALADNLVLDLQNAAFPVPVTRNVGGLQLQELRMLDYPYFVDLRRDGLVSEHPVTAGLEQLTMAWSSPLSITAPADTETDVNTRVLLQSSDNSWTSSSIDIMPRLDEGRVSGWSPEGDTGPQVLGAMAEGRFRSWFAGKESPLLAQADSEDDQTDETDTASDTPIDTAVIEQSSESARLVVFASNDFLRDEITQLAGAATGTAYLGGYQLMANAIDHALDDAGLLAIRSRGQYNRLLLPMDAGQQRAWEYANYALAAALVTGSALLMGWLRRRRQKRYTNWYSSTESLV